MDREALLFFIIKQYNFRIPFLKPRGAFLLFIHGQRRCLILKYYAAELSDSFLRYRGALLLRANG